MKPLHLGKIIKVGDRKWRVGAVGDVGERYYWLVNPDDDKDVAMFPACVVETDENRGNTRRKPMTDKEKDELIKKLITEYRHGWLIWSTPEVYCGFVMSRYWENVYTDIIKKHENL